MKLKTYLISGCVAVLGLASCRGTSEIIERSQYFADRHNFHQAYWIVAQALDEYPDDEQLGRLFWERRLEYLLDRGQQLVFDEHEQQAIEEFQKALALDPENQMAKDWIDRSRTNSMAPTLELGD